MIKDWQELTQITQGAPVIWGDMVIRYPPSLMGPAFNIRLCERPSMGPLFPDYQSVPKVMNNSGAHEATCYSMALWKRVFSPMAMS